ncbi:hypothetical protein [Bacillus thuringiensis]|uniref:hypothetical protein n=1 Tax=Bacillus thuringiensis TaxID=1428 RepID=UPI000E2FC284|nr:hypothetical protein [Bacillus thuringiensis]RFB53134.1 hypothetical protein DZB90_27260 [Bacillus thuringiensis]
MNTLQDGFRFPLVLYGKSAATGKQAEYKYGVSHGSLQIMKIIGKNAGIEFDNINEVIEKYYDTYRIKSVNQLV